MNFSNRKIITRFAPSPTGFMHVGSIRTALFAWLWARKNNGEFILRIEDTDKKREVEGSIEHIIKSLKWLDIDWDKGPEKQSERLKIYKKYAKKLIDKGLAYADPYNKDQLDKFRKKAEEEKKPFLYRNHRPNNFEQWDETKPLRFKVSEIKRYQWNDLVFGNLSAGEEALDDFILIKSDGYPTYNFAHIVDDIEMNVTHIMRGQEFISSTPKFLSLYEALEINPPKFVTLPPILSERGNKKLSKRDGSKDILDYKKEGYLPEAIINFLAFLGWNPGNEKEIFSLQELIKKFDISKVQKSGAHWNEEKLNWINKEYLRELGYEEQKEYILNFLPKDFNISNEMLHNLVPIIIDRISKGNDIQKMAEEGELNYFLNKPELNKEKLFFKSSKIPIDLKNEILAGFLEKLVKIIEGTEEFTKEKIKEKIWPFANELGRGDILWPMRYSLSGLEKSPDPFTIAEILGKEETIERIRGAIRVLKS